jgi:protein involved in ribonucleotide reduction
MSFLKYDQFIIESSTHNKHIMLVEKKRSKDVESSHLDELKYDDDTQILEITFNNGSTYRYKSVPKSVYKELAEEQNILRKIGSGIVKGAKKLFGKQVEEGTYGTRFWELIRRGGYEYEKIN